MFDFEISGTELKAHFAKVIDGATAELTEFKNLAEKIATSGGTAEEIAKLHSRGFPGEFAEKQLQAKIAALEFFASKVDEKRTYTLGLGESVTFSFLKIPGLPL